MTMEDFTNLADKEIGIKIREKRFQRVKETATYADDSVLALRASGSKQPRGNPYTRKKPVSEAS